VSNVQPPLVADCVDGDSPSIELLIEGRQRDVGGFSVRRVLPFIRKRLVGPFVFFDHMGPAEFAPGIGFDVRPHPHIALATVTFLFDGQIMHRDSVGSVQEIRPGDVNWMIAGGGIVHSERSPDASRRDGGRMHGIQSWVAMPLADEEMAPAFEHHDASALPRLTVGGAELDVIAGTAYGKESPVGVRSPTLYVHARLGAGARLPMDADHEERAVYVVEGTIGCDAKPIGAGTMIVLRPGADVTIASESGARVMIVGGAKLEGERHLFWNFVSSSKERLEKAKDDWKNRRFPTIPGDDVEFIPLPEH
jgi:redox-sensitive bicupin YhaK (pirin superfamily)